jgi:protein-L-isoaspartate(D-aspartate) O-methyltransferase
MTEAAEEIAMRPAISRAGFLLLIAAGVAGCPARPTPTGSPDEQRRQMVERDLQGRDIRDEKVLAAMLEVPRHEFVPRAVRRRAYGDHPLSIGHGQTISQPYVVALMTQAISPKPGQRVLEVGTGSGYQAAVLAEIVAEVYTIELIPELARTAEERLKLLGYRNVRVRAGDGYQGWPEAAPFDAVVVTCGAEEVPEPLFDQLRPGGKMVIPVGPTGGVQSLRLITRGPGGKREVRDLGAVRFVPLRRPGSE